MEQLTIHDTDIENFVESRNLYACLGVEMPYEEWIVKTLKGYERNIHYQTPEVFINSSNSEPALAVFEKLEYLITTDCAKEIAKAHGGRTGLDVSIALTMHDKIRRRDN